MKVILEGAEAEKYAVAVKLFDLARALELAENYCGDFDVNAALKNTLREFLEECKYINAKRKEQPHGNQ